MIKVELIAYGYKISTNASKLILCEMEIEVLTKPNKINTYFDEKIYKELLEEGRIPTVNEKNALLQFIALRNSGKMIQSTIS